MCTYSRGSMCKCVCVTRVHGNALCILPCFAFVVSSLSAGGHREAQGPFPAGPRRRLAQIVPGGSWPALPKLTTASEVCILLKAQPTFLSPLVRALPLRISRRGGLRGNPFLPAPSNLWLKRYLLWLLLLGRRSPISAPWHGQFQAGSCVYPAPLPCQFWESGLRVSDP